MLRMISSAPRTVVSTFTPPPLYWSGIKLLPALDAQVFAHPGLILLQNVVILPQRIALPFLRQQQTLQIRMPLKNDAEHVVDFTLQPIGRRPDALHARHRFVFTKQRLDAEAFILRKRVKEKR